MTHNATDRVPPALPVVTHIRPCDIDMGHRPVVYIVGPKMSGKTSLANVLCEGFNTVKLNGYDPDLNEQLEYILKQRIDYREQQKPIVLLIDDLSNVKTIYK